MSLVKKESGEKINPRKIQQKYLEGLEDSLTEQGVIFYDVQNNSLNIDSDYLILPKHITEVPSKELGEYLNAVTQQKIYIGTLSSRQEIVVELAKREYFSMSEGYYKSLSSSKLSETAKDRILNSHVDIKPCYEKYTDELKKLDVLRYALNNVDSAIFLLSREVTRRNSEFEAEYRNESVGSKKRK